MRFLRTASTGRLLAAIAAFLVLAGGGAAIAVAATTGGPVPPARPLAQTLHTALSAQPVAGVSAQITFTDNLVDSTDFTGQGTDPLLQGASGRLWAGDGRLRIELQSDNGDAQIVVDHRSFWVSDPTQNVVYEGTLPAAAQGGAASHSGVHKVPSISRIERDLTALMGRVDLSSAQPTDVAGHAAYRVTVSPKANPGLVGSAQLAWDAVRGVPLKFALYARGDRTPVLALNATSISYGAVPASDFAVAPPAGARVIRLGALGSTAARSAHARHPRHADTAPGSPVSGPRAVAARLDFTLHAPTTLAGQARSAVRGLGAHAAELRYGSGFGGITVIESRASARDAAGTGQTSVGSLSLPTREVAGTRATVLSTALGTVVHLTRGGVAYTVLGSVPGATALSAARGLF